MRYARWGHSPSDGRGLAKGSINVLRFMYIDGHEMAGKEMEKTDEKGARGPRSQMGVVSLLAVNSLAGQHSMAHVWSPARGRGWTNNGQ